MASFAGGPSSVGVCQLVAGDVFVHGHVEQVNAIARALEPAVDGCGIGVVVVDRLEL